MQPRRDFRRVQYYSPNPQRRVRQPVAQKSKRPGVKTIIGLMAIVLVAGLGLHHAGASSSQDAPKESAMQTAPPEPVKPTITQSQMAEQIQKVIAANPDVDISVSVGDPRDGSVTHYGTEAVYEAASVAKVLTGVFYLHDVEAGRLSLDKKIGDSNARQYLKIMIEQSDNTAWKTFNDILDRDRLREYAKSIGFERYNPKDNTFTSNGIAQLLVQLQQGKLLNYEHTQLVLGHMKNASRSEYIAPALPAEAKLYHKAGWLEDRVHDAAVIDDGHRPYILVIFTNGHAKYHATPRETILREIAKVTVARFISSEFSQSTAN